MLVWDIFHIRTREEVEAWSIPRFFCHLWAFPKEEEEIAERALDEGFERSAIVENAKGMPKVVVEGVLLLLTLYIVPPYELTKNMSQLAYHCYCDALGLSVSAQQDTRYPRCSLLMASRFSWRWHSLATGC